jgi:hypothetical protein
MAARVPEKFKSISLDFAVNSNDSYEFPQIANTTLGQH